jgi:hypothetical protein
LAGGGSERQRDVSTSSARKPFETGDLVERCYGRGEHRSVRSRAEFGRATTPGM